MEQDLEFQDFDDFSYKLSRKYRYEDSEETFYFLSENPDAEEIELRTAVSLAYKVTPAKSVLEAETDLDCFDQLELIAWSVGDTVEYHSGEVIEPSEVLTAEEFQRYSTGLQEFIEGFE